MPKALTDGAEPINILYYGDGGTGKTTDIAHMAKVGPVVIVNAEGGVKARALKQYGIPMENIFVFPDTDAGEELTFEGLEALWLSIREKLAKDPGSIAGVGWDSITEIYQALLGDIVKRSYAKAIKQGKDRDPEFIALEDYGIMTQQMRSLVRKYRDLQCHFAISALARREQDDDGSITYNPQVTAKLQSDLVGWVDVVCVTQTVEYTDDEEDEYRGLFRPVGKWRGKDRFKMLPKGIVDPTFDRVLAYIDGEMTADDDPVMKAAKARMERNLAKGGPVEEKPEEATPEAAPEQEPVPA